MNSVRPYDPAAAAFAGLVALLVVLFVAQDCAFGRSVEYPAMVMRHRLEPAHYDYATKRTIPDRTHILLRRANATEAPEVILVDDDLTKGLEPGLVVTISARIGWLTKYEYNQRITELRKAHS